MVFVLVFFTNPFFFFLIFSVLVSINLSTPSVCSFGNQLTGINLQHFQWEMEAGWTCFSRFLCT